VKKFLALLVWASLAFAQEIEQELDRLQRLVNTGDWAAASEASKTLKQVVADARDHALMPQSAGLVDSILNWMPPDTETLLVQQEPFALSGDKAATIGYVANLLGAAEKDELSKRLGNRTITLAVVGARKFGEGGPSDGRPRLGMIPYEGCAVYRFSEEVPEPLLLRAPEDHQNGLSVWQSKGSEGDPPDWETFYVSRVDAHAIAVCNNESFFNEILSRRANPQPNRALPAGLREWQLVDRASPAWAISHYHSNGVQSMYAPEATGIAVSFGKTNFIARVISPANPWEEFSTAPEFQGAATHRKMAEDIWELAVPSRGEPGMMGIFSLMGVIGFAVAL
jgi:hypothetical protein